MKKLILEFIGFGMFFTFLIWGVPFIYLALTGNYMDFGGAR